jgi:CheY-like chemotaxis protein
MQVAHGLTTHTVLLVVEKHERAVATQALLGKFGYKVVVATGLYDAIKMVGQEMPHLVICEVTLPDGTVVNLCDKLSQDKLLNKTPILAHSIKKSADEINQIKSRKFAGAYAGAVEPKTFMGKVIEVINNCSAISPFYFGASQCGIVEDLTLKIESTVMGKIGDAVLLRSGTEVDQNASMLCVPKSQELAPAVLRMATNMKHGEEVFNLFPVGRIVGKGRVWLEKLPVFNMDGGNQPAPGAPAATGAPRRVIFYDPNESRFEGFKQLLGGYDIDLVYAKTLNIAAGLLAKGPDAVGGVYIHEMLNDSSSAEWKNIYSKIPSSSRPPLIVGTTAAGMKSSDAMRYIKRPFGMGILVEMMESTFTRATKVAAVAGAQAPNAVTGTAVSLQAPAKIIGLDETGGVLQMKFPVAKGSKVEMIHPEIGALLGVQAVVITSVATLPNQPDVVQARFESIGAGQSKAKYWEKISKTLSDRAAKIAAEAKAQEEASQPAGEPAA